MAELKPGDVAPPFEAQDQDGNTLRLADFKGRKVFVYFYPKANTSGWTAQSQSVRDAQPRLKALDIAVMGISPDEKEEQKSFDEKLRLGFPLLCDTDHRIASAYGVWGSKEMFGKTIEGIVRSSFLIDDQGKVARAWYRISPQETVPELMKALEKEERS